MAALYIGTCGWMYPSWRHDWYEDRPSKTWLGYIDEKLGAVELDGAFYRQQKKETFEKWASQVSDDFCFALRGHRFITHSKRLKDVSESIKRVREPALGLGNKLKAVLWQLPPSMKKDAARLADFGRQLAEWREVTQVVEFRHTSWFDEEIEKVMKDYDLVNCISDAGKFERWDAVTGKAVYVRLHGRPQTYLSSYSHKELESWAQKVKEWRRQRREVFVFFDNDIKGAAPWNAFDLKKLILAKTEKA